MSKEHINVRLLKEIENSKVSKKVKNFLTTMIKKEILGECTITKWKEEYKKQIDIFYK